VPEQESDEAASSNGKLDIVIKLLAAIYTKGASKTESITKLSELQLSPKQIAAVVGVSGHHVSQVLYTKKKAPKTKADKKEGLGDHQ
jgi:hypothetical protein